MSKYYVLYHRLDRNDSSRSKADGVSKFLPNDELIFKDVLEINDYQSFFDNLEDEDGIIVTGGDGSLHKFINRTNGINHNHHIYYFPTGTGNDFYKDISLYRGLSQLAEKLARDIERQDLIVTEKESAFKEAHPNLTDDEINYCRLAESRDEINAKLKTLTEQQKQEPDNRGLKRQKELLQDKLIGIHKELKENPFFKKSIDDQKAARNQYSTCKEELGSIEK